MGWALKSNQGGKIRFSDKQRDYLTSKFLIGEENGQKASPLQVSQSMMTVNDATGNHMFSSSEFLTVQQITSFFSHLASKRSLPGISISRSILTMRISDSVMTNILPTHPICYDSFNLCQLMSKWKLSTLAVKLLKEICCHYSNVTESTSSRRKAPYIKKLEEFLKQCAYCKT